MPTARIASIACLTAALAASAVGCGSRDLSTPPPPLPADTPPPEGPVETRLRERAPTDAPYLIPDGTPLRATLATNERASFTHVLVGGVCYKVLAQGGPGITDLDVLLYDPNGALWQRDTTHDAEPVLGSDRGICPGDPGAWRVEVVAAAGSGDVVAQFWVAP